MSRLLPLAAAAFFWHRCHFCFSAGAGEIIAIFSNGDFDNIHARLLDKITIQER
ncbi:MAG: hypothetical protein CDV28_102218 [Candidatus Electronema aureum]|uniref:Uncharacterized protein n=1 Tax=Candidatus Electronema aureum TaxID=2005002 RepID=A0A521G535_9BACT|nr:MAG: hypothetical protein CDV28_102218 [Candidatus Electronema aureum]